MTKPEKLLKNIILLVLVVLFLVYFCRQIASITNSPIETETALAVTVDEKFTTEGYVMRKERILTSPVSGIKVACVGEGERISKGNPAVKIFMNESDTETENSIKSIDARLDVLRNSAIDLDYVSADISKLDTEIGAILDEAAVYASENDLSGCVSRRDSLLVDMNKRWLISNPEKNYNDRMNALISERNSLSARLSSPSVCYATDSGYFSSAIDGYEGIFDAGNIDSLTLSSFRSMIASEPAAISDSAAGKIILDYKWYLACLVPFKEAEKMNVGEDYPVEFPYSDGLVLPMNLYSKVSDNDGGDVLVIMSCVHLPEGFEYERKQKVNIIYSSYTGLKIPKKAVRFADDLRGVYVLRGSDVEFELIRDIYSFDDYYIIDMEKENYPTLVKSTETVEKTDEKGKTYTEEIVNYYRPLSLYDSVIINEKGLSDGSHVE